MRDCPHARRNISGAVSEKLIKNKFKFNKMIDEPHIVG
jgi:hypothetical protein